MTALTLYGSNVASTTLSTAAQLSSATGGTETHVTTTGPSSGTGYVEIFGKTGTSSLNASIPSPTGKGFLWDVTTLEGQTIAAGSWTAAVGMLDTAGTGPTTSFTMRFFKRSSGGVYTSIGSITDGADTIHTSRTTYALSGSALGSMAFASGDKLYVDFWFQANGWGSDPIENFVTTSATQGLANDFQITTPGYAPSVTTNTRTITPASMPLIGTQQRVVPASMPLIATDTRTITPASMPLLQTTHRAVPESMPLIATDTRVVPESMPLIATDTRQVPESMPLIGTQSRAVPESMPLIATPTRSVPESMPLVWTQERVVPASMPLSGGALVRQVPASMPLLATNARVVGASLPLLATVVRVVPAAMPLSAATSGPLKTPRGTISAGQTPAASLSAGKAPSGTISLSKMPTGTLKED